MKGRARLIVRDNNQTVTEVLVLTDSLVIAGFPNGNGYTCEHWHDPDAMRRLVPVVMGLQERGLDVLLAS